MKSHRQVDNFEMYLKAFLVVAVSIAAYVVLVFRDNSGFVDVLAGFVLALGLVGIGFNVQHDGNHGGFSKHKAVNYAAGFTLDIIGASSYFWKEKHNVAHHTYTNIPHEDGDINFGWLARMSADDRWLWFHRYQHIYLWFLYSFVHLRYLFTDTYRMIVGRSLGFTRRKMYPKGYDLAGLILGKIIFFTLAFVLPLSQHHWMSAIGGYVAVSMTMGIMFSVVFQLAHTVDVVEHPSHQDGPNRAEWVVHQIRTTANFATHSRFLRVALGGLNFQREHHLFPRISHIHYPAIANVVLEVCGEFNISHCENETFGDALRSHYRYLKLMGCEPHPPLEA